MPAGDPVPDTEYVLRCVPRGYFDRRKPIPLAIQSFLPDSHDVDGLSVFRASIWQVDGLLSHRSDKVFHVLELHVGELRRFSARLGRTLSIVGDDDPPGHAHIPETRRDLYLADKRAFKTWADQIVAELARPETRVGRIVHDAGPMT